SLQGPERTDRFLRREIPRNNRSQVHSASGQKGPLAPVARRVSDATCRSQPCFSRCPEESARWKRRLLASSCYSRASHRSIHRSNRIRLCDGSAPIATLRASATKAPCRGTDL